MNERKDKDSLIQSALDDYANKAPAPPRSVMDKANALLRERALAETEKSVVTVSQGAESSSDGKKSRGLLPLYIACAAALLFLIILCPVLLLKKPAASADWKVSVPMEQLACSHVEFVPADFLPFVDGDVLDYAEYKTMQSAGESYSKRDDVVLYYVCYRAGDGVSASVYVETRGSSFPEFGMYKTLPVVSGDVRMERSDDVTYVYFERSDYAYNLCVTSADEQKSDEVIEKILASF